MGNQQENFIPKLHSPRQFAFAGTEPQTSAGQEGNRRSHPRLLRAIQRSGRQSRQIKRAASRLPGHHAWVHGLAILWFRLGRRQYRRGKSDVRPSGLDHCGRGRNALAFFDFRFRRSDDFGRRLSRMQTSRFPRVCPPILSPLCMDTAGPMWMHLAQDLSSAPTRHGSRAFLKFSHSDQRREQRCSFNARRIDPGQCNHRESGQIVACF